MADESKPVYLRLREIIAASILDGEFTDGDLLPSVRAFAAAQGANPLTVAKAYQSFQDDGLVVVKRGVGMFVSDGATRRLREIAGKSVSYLTRLVPHTGTRRTWVNDLEDWANRQTQGGPSDVDRQRQKELIAESIQSRSLSGSESSGTRPTPGSDSANRSHRDVQSSASSVLRVCSTSRMRVRMLRRISGNTRL